MSFLIRLVINAVAIWLAAQWVSGIDIATPSGDYSGLWVVLFIALVFTVVNAFVKPLVQLLSLPLLILTLGLFTLVINALMLLLTSWITESTDWGISVEGFWTAVWGALIISVVNFVLTAVFPSAKR
ncbi:phage holin family protein [Rhodococcus tukisamuensis]|uniref:Putative membrane protein n=1 Tax=Rhodococcus tukisamuensis TaxID=168276 RepID=A0A1G6WI80_9NOCA|nr:phage holin family protein [Rhodococcus tukisamuensis]SDD64785.1 putative membrane protein [Rhodococcus tukisamuensis]